MALGVATTTQSQANNSCTITVSKPSGTVAGSVLVAWFSRNNSAGIPITTDEFSNTSFGFAFAYKAAFADLDMYVRIAGCCEPCTYTFTARSFSLRRTTVILDRLTCAAHDWDENTGVPVGYSSNPSQFSTYCNATSTPYNADQVCGQCGTCRNYIAWVAFSGGSGVNCTLNLGFPSNCCGYTDRQQNTCAFLGVWQANSYKVLACATQSENPGCWTINGCAFCTWCSYLKPTTFLVRETCACLCRCLSCCTPVVQSFTSSSGCCTCCLTITHPCCIAACDLLVLVITRCSTSKCLVLKCGWALADRYEALCIFPRDIDVLWKTAVGTEDGTSITFCAGGGSDRYVMQMLRITGAALQAPNNIGASVQTIANPSAPCTLIGLSEPNLVITGLGIFGEAAPTWLRGHVSPIGFCLINRTEGGGTDSTKVVSMIAQKGYQHTNSNAPSWLICNCIYTTAWTIGIAPSDTSGGTPGGSTLTELCVFQYRGISGIASPQDICFILCVLEWREKIETGAVIIGVGLYENIAFPLNYAKIKIKLRARLPANHGVHPLTVDACCNAIGHLPDFVDMEEAALTFNQIGIAKDKVSLSIPLPAGVRTYEGVIESVALIHPPGTTYEELILNFEVDWNPSFPELRAWNNEAV